MGNSLPEDTRSEPFRMYLTAFYFCSYTMTSVGGRGIKKKQIGIKKKTNKDQKKNI